MDSIAVIKPEMGVLSQERLSLSPFGALSQAFAEELLARAERVEGQWSQVPLDLLQEGENQPASPPVRPVIQVDLKLVLEALRKEKNRSEQQRATERIVERILQRRETLRETVIKPAPSEQSEVEKPQAPQHTTQIQQNIYQILNQILRVQRPDGTWGEQLLRQPSETMPAKTGRPGQLGRQAAVFSQTLRVLREEGKAFPVPQTADRQTAGWSAVPGNVPAERSTTPLDLTHREEEAGTETATKSGQQAAVQLLRTAERLERVLRTEAAQTEETIKKETKTMPIVQKMGPNQEHDLPERSAHREQSTGSLHTSEPVSGKKQAQASDAIHTAARQLEQLTRQGAEGDKKQQISAPHPLQTGQRTEQSQPVTARDIRTVTVEKAGKLDGKPAPAATTAHLPSVELTHRTEEEKEVQTPPVQPMEKRRKAEQSQPVTARDIRTVAAEKAGQPDREPAQTATTAPLPGVELTHRTEEEKEDQMSPVQPVEKGRNAEHSQPVTARDIRMVTAETASQAVSEPVPATTAHLPGVELTHRTEEEKEAPIPPVQPMEKGRKAEHSQPVTARDIRTVTAEPASPAVNEPALAAITVPLPSVELTHRTEEEQEAQTPLAQPKEKGQTAEYSQPVTARDIRTVMAETASPAASEPTPTATAPLPGVELTHRTEEEQEAQTPPVQPVERGRNAEHSQPVTARDIRTVSAEKTSPMASGPAPAATTAPLPGVELTHRMEEEKEVQTPPVQPVKKGQAAEYSQPVTARDIRTVSAETANPTDSEPAPASTAAPLPGVELTHRTEEKETQPPTVQQAQKSISRTEQNHPAALRDIRTGKRLSHVQRTTSSNLQSPVFAGGADTAPTSVVSRMAQQSQPSGPIQGGLSPTAMPMGPELTLRTGEAPAGQQFSAGMEHPQLPGERVQRESPLTVAAEDIRVGRRFTKVYTPLGAEAEEEPGPAGVLPPLTLEERQTSPGQPVGETPRNIQRRSAARRAETASQPVELTYGPSQQPAEQAPAQTSKKADGQGESDYVRNLPDWARRFLKESWSGHAGTQEMSVARNISTQQGGEETVQWTAPNYRPAPPMDHREKRQEEPKRPQQVHISEAEIQRTADRVYRILEDRIREERIRLGF
ncbi:hypothetical protein [uncultured Flavonifractor sp.]|uniref:hypothetical protein n=1 Tax=uncultured Flavonifractor sp. TaxID=1193534 RepID=UPI002625BC3B|nr:hypothetical protein [uncultured Flavonifractor sp.]